MNGLVYLFLLFQTETRFDDPLGEELWVNSVLLRMYF